MAALRTGIVLRPRPLASCLATALALALPALATPPRELAFDPYHRAIAEFERTTGRVVGGKRLSRLYGVPNVLHVANCDDHGPGSLRDAIAAADDTDVIDLTHLACSRITLTTGALVSNHGRVGLIGPGADALAIDGSGSDRVIVNTGDWGVKLSGLSIVNGASADQGGCIYSASAVSLYSTSVASCHADGRGGAVYATSQFFMFHSTLADNTSAAADAAGGGAYVKSGFTGVVQSTLSGNSAPNGCGGALWTRDDTYVSRSTLSANAALDGGAFATSASGDSFASIAGSTISGNTAARGGGMSFDSVSRIADDTIAFNSATANGGGLYIKAATTLLNTIVANNLRAGVADDIDGSIARIPGSANLIQASTIALPADTLDGDPLLGPLADHGGFTLTHALLSGSIAIDAGNNESFLRYDQRNYGSARTIGAAPDIGAYEVRTIGSTTIVKNCLDEGPGSLRDAIAHAKSGDTLDLSALDCPTLALAGALEIPLGTLTLIGPGAARLTIDGGGTDRALYHSGYGTLTVSGITFAHGDGSADYRGGGCLHSRSTLDMTDAVVEGCTVYGDSNAIGGGIYAGRLSLTRSTVSGNRSMAVLFAKAGGVIVYGDLTMRDSTISGNRAVTTYDLAEPKASSRGAGLMVVRGGNVDISGSTISGNIVGNSELELPGYFAGLAIVYANYMNASRVINTTISGNVAASATGGVYATSALTLRNSTVAFNTAVTGAQYGAALATGVDTAAPWINVYSSIIANNSAGVATTDLGGSPTIFGKNDAIMTSVAATPPDTLTDDPELEPLQDNGGPTATHALASTSPVIDRGNNDASLATDQRGVGYARVVGASADIGAFERQKAPPDAVFADGFDG